MEASESLYHYVSRHSGFAALSSCLLFVGTLVYSVGLNTNKSSTIWFSHMRRAERHGAFTLRRSRPLPSSTDDGRTLFQTAFALHGVSKVQWVFDYCTKSSTIVHNVLHFIARNDAMLHVMQSGQPMTARWLTMCWISCLMSRFVNFWFHNYDSLYHQQKCWRLID